jgi:hypothetical protein
MVVACIALAVALGGTSYAAIRLPRNSVGTSQLRKNAVTSPKVKNNSLNGADVNEASLGTVPSATNAANADKLDDIDSTGFVRPGSEEGWHEIGAPGEPTFQNGWINESPNYEATAAFYKDPLDVVHLKGVVKDGTGTVFTLPAGYRPTKGSCWSSARNGAVAYICFNANGWVYQNYGSATGPMLLDGLTFRVS